MKNILCLIFAVGLILACGGCDHQGNENEKPVYQLYEKEAVRHYAAYKATGVLPDFSMLTETRPTRDDAYVFQEYYAKAFLADGDRLIGYKLGFTGKAAPPGAAPPLLGRIFESQLVDDSRAFFLSELGNPIVEIELAFRFKKDLELGADKETIIAAIDSVAGAVEVPNPNYKKPEHFNGLNFIAHSVVSKRLLLGEWTSFSETLALNELEVALTKPDGEQIFFKSQNVLPHDNRHHYAAIQYAVNELGSRNQGIRAGDILITGSMGYALSGARDDTGKAVAGTYQMIQGDYAVDFGPDLGALDFTVTD